MAQRTPNSVLVVDCDLEALTRTVAVLRSSGYSVLSASEFSQAKQILDRQDPDLLVTAVRLGLYNGLHLVLRGHMNNPRMAAIVLSSSLDPVLQVDARQQGAAYLVTPLSDRDFHEAVARSMTGSGLSQPPVPEAGPEVASGQAV
jgi:DNA-binding response OmpR family regulator